MALQGEMRHRGRESLIKISRTRAAYAPAEWQRGGSRRRPAKYLSTLICVRMLGFPLPVRGAVLLLSVEKRSLFLLGTYKLQLNNEQDQAGIRRGQQFQPVSHGYAPLLANPRAGQEGMR